MAATIAIATGLDKTRVKTVHRLGSTASTGEANTYRTFAKCHIRKDGSGFVEVVRDGREIHRHVFGPE